MNELEVKRVPFMGTDLMAARDEGGTVTRPVLSRAQLARQIAELTRYQA